MSETVRALIFNKVQGSFVDGWGVRTTIFLKGCPLRCKWCCNPEGQSFQPELKVVYDDCNGCGRCVDLCPEKALSMKDGVVCVDRSVCTVCGNCADFCFTGALEPFGRCYTVDEMFDFLIKDKPFYDASSGGVTIGGGEATCFGDFVLPLMDRLQAAGVHVAIDSCGYNATEKGLEVLKRADLVLFDIKGWDAKRHEENTGVSNELIWKNLRMLDAMHKPVIIRMPIIPGHNDSREEIEAEAEALSQIKSIKRVDILPMHKYGHAKYDEIGKEYTLDDLPGVPEDYQQWIKQLFESKGFATQIGG